MIPVEKAAGYLTVFIICTVISLQGIFYKGDQHPMLVLVVTSTFVFFACCGVISFVNLVLGAFM